MTNDFLPELRLVGDASASRLLELADSLKRLSPQDEWAIFIGAGLSVGSDVPGWNTFLREAGTRFKVSVGTIDEDNYPRVAQDCLEAAPTPDDFWAFTEERLCGTHGSDHAQRLAIGLPFQLFLTTNFDCLLEAAHSQIRAADPRRLVYPDLPARHGCEGRLVYLHGRCDCDKATGQRIRPEHIVFTRMGTTGPTITKLGLCRCLFNPSSVRCEFCSLDSA